MVCLVELYETILMASQHLAWHDAVHACLNKLDVVLGPQTRALQMWEVFPQPQYLQSIERGCQI